MITLAAPLVAIPRSSVAVEPGQGIAQTGHAKGDPLVVYIPNGCDAQVLVHNRSYAVVLATGVGATGTAGTLADGVYGFYFTVTTSFGEGLPGPEILVEVLDGGGSGSITLTWTDLTQFEYAQGATVSKYNIYGRTAGGTALKMAALDPGVQTWTDDGSVTPTGDLPATDASGKSVSMAIATCADEASRTVDPSTVQPVTIAAGGALNLGPYVAKYYGQGASGRDLQLTFTGDDLENLMVYPLRANSGG